MSNFHRLQRDFLTEMRPVFSKMSLTRYCFSVEFTDCNEIDAVYCSLGLSNTLFKVLKHCFQTFIQRPVVIVQRPVLLDECRNILQQYHGK